MITIMDYGVENLASVQNMLRKYGVSAQGSNDPKEILHSTKLILPGAGELEAAMEKVGKSVRIPLVPLDGVNSLSAFLKTIQIQASVARNMVVFKQSLRAALIIYPDQPTLGNKPYSKI
ncbi:MAG: hypothetical protein C0490_06465 [Marivirga sp.]|nr:hypothetical protein [Marivirga sp.]